MYLHTSFKMSRNMIILCFLFTLFLRRLEFQWRRSWMVHYFAKCSRTLRFYIRSLHLNQLLWCHMASLGHSELYWHDATEFLNLYLLGLIIENVIYTMGSRNGVPSCEGNDFTVRTTPKISILWGGQRHHVSNNNYLKPIFSVLVRWYHTKPCLSSAPVYQAYCGTLRSNWHHLGFEKPLSQTF